MRILNCLAAFFFCLFSVGASAWTIHADFDSGEIGTKAERASDSFTGAAGHSLYSDEQSIKGQSAKLHIQEGKTGWGRWGGEFMFPEKVRRGQTIWYQVHVYFPKEFDHYSYGAGNRLKFLRLTTKSRLDKNHGFLDLYVDMKTSPVPFKWIYEGAGRWVDVGQPSDMIVKDRWESYQMAVTLDNIPKSEGGTAEVKIWKNGILLTHAINEKTLKESTDYSHRALLFTYWNGGSPKTHSMYVDNITITTEKPNSVDRKGNPRLRSLITSRPKTIIDLIID